MVEIGRVQYRYRVLGKFEQTHVMKVEGSCKYRWEAVVLLCTADAELPGAGVALPVFWWRRSSLVIGHV